MHDYVLDPEGDVIFTLTNGNASAAWDPIEHGEASSDREGPATAMGSPLAGSVAEYTLPDEQDPELARLGHQPNNENSGDNGAETDALIKFRVSSRHLVLASSVFKAMLGKEWMESKAHADGYFYIEGEDWSVEAFLIVMNIIHGHNRTVPRVVDLTMLTKVAIIVDYYEFYEATEVFSGIWMEHLRKSVPTTYCRDLALWVCVSQIFGDEKIFHAVTRLAIRLVPRRMKTLELPILDSIKVEIESRRTKAIQRMVHELHILKNDLLDQRRGCSFACSMIHLGTLMYFMKECNILEQSKQDPFPGKSLAEVMDSIRGFSTPSWCDRHGTNRRCSGHSCSLITFLDPVLSDVENSLSGLVLVDFASMPISKLAPVNS